MQNPFQMDDLGVITTIFGNIHVEYMEGNPTQ